ncbi:xylulokinase [Erysipelothrix sp. HDW6C]|uniref:xylulokinase n=1 Tax=Erysipelothrix sp. HDW6C TaxID=2714930 RepID=UPI00140AECAD|nr:xylulokinase [Erysipelothrix sp. HDW6C]QIK70292.1 xylulokinase [Erysipelothrix sp. HDW6C]
MNYVIGIDLGTGSLKGLVMKRTGEVITSASQSYPVHNPHVGYSEQNPEDWYQAFLKVMDALILDFPDLVSHCAGISFSGQMHTLVILDDKDRVLRPAILWNDVRTSLESDWINEHYYETLMDITLNRSLEGFTLPKLLWVQKNEPETYRLISSILLPKDYLRFRITGTKHMDYSDAAGTLLLDVEKEQWSEPICATFSIPMAALPELCKSTDTVSMMHADLRDYFGFTHDVAIYAGGADNACAALGSGIVDSEDAMLSIGTSGVFLATEDSIVNYDGALHFFNHCIPAYYSMGVTLSAGASLSWIKSILAPDADYESFLAEIPQIQPGSDGLLFTPYIMGERTPFFDASIRGSFVGLDAMHTRVHFVRSVLEGITYSLKNAYDIMKKHKKTDFKRIISVGGGAKNKEWLQIQADVFNLPVATLEVEEGPALGAAMLAALGADWFESVDACIKTCVRISETIKPRPVAVAVYRDYYNIYCQVYASQRDISAQLLKKRTTS